MDFYLCLVYVNIIIVMLGEFKYLFIYKHF